MISILDYCRNVLNKDPVKKGSTYFIHSPFTAEKTPSFAIYEKTNSFFDWSADFGGDVIELNRRLKNLTRQESYVDLISNGLDRYTPAITLDYARKNQVKKTFTINSVTELSDIKLLDYAKNARGIPIPIIKENCVQVNYDIVSSKNGQTYTFNAIGFKNDSGGYEVRNEKTKLSFNKKDITTYLHEKNNLHIFEGFFDFLTYLRLIDSIRPKSSCIILNSVSMIDRVQPANYDNVYTWFDNDHAGDDATNKIKSIFKKVTDMREKYRKFPDLNDMIKNKQ